METPNELNWMMTGTQDPVDAELDPHTLSLQIANTPCFGRFASRGSVCSGCTISAACEDEEDVFDMLVRTGLATRVDPTDDPKVEDTEIDDLLFDLCDAPEIPASIIETPSEITQPPETTAERDFMAEAEAELAHLDEYSTIEPLPSKASADPDGVELWEVPLWLASAGMYSYAVYLSSGKMMFIIPLIALAPLIYTWGWFNRGVNGFAVAVLALSCCFAYPTPDAVDQPVQAATAPSVKTSKTVARRAAPSPAKKVAPVAAAVPVAPRTGCSKANGLTVLGKVKELLKHWDNVDDPPGMARYVFKERYWVAPNQIPKCFPISVLDKIRADAGTAAVLTGEDKAALLLKGVARYKETP